LGTIYEYLLSSSSRDRALNYISEDYRSARIVYTVEADASDSEVTEDTQSVAEDMRYEATATGDIVVFQAVSDVIFESAVLSLAIALGGTAVFLVVIYTVLEGRPSLGVVNIVPVVVTVALLAGSMRYLGIPFNAITGTILALTIGLGVDYSVHVVHRFADEHEQTDLVTALERTVRGTGGALLGSMLTTAFGIGVLALAVFPAMGQFGILTALSVLYAFLTSVLVLPSVLVVWDRLTNHGTPFGGLFDFGQGRTPTPADDD